MKIGNSIGYQKSTFSIVYNWKVRLDFSRDPKVQQTAKFECSDYKK